MVPEISVVTVVKNNSTGLENTLKSVISQKFANWECLIISAESTDDTQSIADTFARKDSRFLHFHESLQGIYESMNQGVLLATAPYVVFMNAGDIFASTQSIDVLRNEIISENYAVVVGGYASEGVIYSFSPLVFGPKRFSLNRRWGCHQSMVFNRKEILSLAGFSTAYKLSSDFDLVLKLLSKSKGKRIQEVISVIEPNGISSKYISVVLREKQNIRKSHFGEFSSNSLLGYFWTLAVRFKIGLRRLSSVFS